MKTSLHTEINFETEICQHLAAHGWHHSPNDTGYDVARALFPEDVVAWVQATQPQAWETLTKSQGAKAQDALCQRLRDCIQQRGTLDVLRNGIDMIGLRQTLFVAEIQKPALGALNPDTMAKYNANRLRVMQQVHYSAYNRNCIDLVLFLNGIPVATVELKTDFTQSVQDAVEQYKYDRHPHPKGQSPEPLLAFGTGALVHFAVSNLEAQMTTHLKGPATKFLPFNQGYNQGAGNPPNPNGHPTAYLWERIWERDTWLDILGRYLVVLRDKKNQMDSVVFPRYHQWDVTQKLQQAILAEGPGGKYLIQHSAGSGKTKSIAWTAHFLANLHDESQGHRKVFDTVLVVSDRTVIDDQLQDEVLAFERTKGVVAIISRENTPSKSSELAESLSKDKKIVVCTIQTFPFALKAVQEMAATQGKNFAVIADEAHSSQTGDAAAKLKAVLSLEEQRELEDGAEISAEDLLAAQMANRADTRGITFVAFTATPKNKTMELFGRRPNPELPAGPDNLPEPFHVYSMRQAIEEGFILDVLQNYTPYKLAFKIAENGQELDEKQVERSEAVKAIMRFVRLHDYNISQKVQIVVEHFRDVVAPRLNGQAKAMVVVASRLEAVRWKLAIEKYIQEQGYDIGTLVAFSGEVNDQESGSEPFTETSPAMNPNLRRRDIRDAFKTDEFQILLVANKYQTGFDQPLLCGMYVDKRLAGIQAVQTLCRLNRAYPGKTAEDIYILDFVNNTEEILSAFKTYLDTAELENVTDPNLVYNLRAKLDSQGYYDDFEVERVVAAELNPKSRQSDLVAAINPVADRLLRRYKDAQVALRDAQDINDPNGAQDAKDVLNALLLFKSDMEAFNRMYAFLSQIFDYGNTAIEKRVIFYKRLLPLLEFGREREGVDISKVVLTHHKLKSLGKRTLALGSGEKEKLLPISEAGSGSVQEKQKALLVEIIDKMNDLFEVELTEDDKLIYVNNVLKGKLLESKTLCQQAANNTKEQFSNSPDLLPKTRNAIMDAFDAHTTMSKQALASEKILRGIIDILLGPGELYEALREKADLEQKML